MTESGADVGGAPAPYGSRFFDHILQTSQESAEQVVPVIKEFLQPSSLVDVGCGGGVWLAACLRFGIRDVLGIDGPWVDTDSLHVPRELFRPVDLRVGFRVPRRFDVAMSLETAEHLDAASADDFVRSLTALAPLIVFSAAIPGQGGTMHLNEQWPEYWVARFADHGYRVVDCFRPRLWLNEKVAWWYAQNTLLFADESQLSARPDLRRAAEATSIDQLSLVHPRNYTRIVGYLNDADPRQKSVGELWPHIRAAAARSLKRRWRSRLNSLGLGRPSTETHATRHARESQPKA